MYYADIITEDDLKFFGKQRRCAFRLFNNIKSCKHSVTQSLLDKPRKVHEVIIYKQFETKPDRIHGYYEWTGDKLKLMRGVDPFVHNVIYGRM